MSLVSTHSVIERFRAVHPVPGARYFVSADASMNIAGRTIVPLDANDGVTPYTPFKTITRALSKAVDGAGTVIYLMGVSKFVESVSVSKGNITLIGMNDGSRAIVEPLAGGLPLLVMARRFAAYNIRFSSTGAVGAAIHGGDNYHYEGCDFSSATLSGLLLMCQPGTSPNTASEGRIVNCMFRENGVNGLGFIASADGRGVTGVQVERCLFFRNTAADIVDSDNTSGTLMVQQDNEFRDCVFMSNKHGSAYISCASGASSNGIISGCRFGDKTGLTATEIVLSAGIIFTGNYDATGLVDGSGF